MLKDKITSKIKSSKNLLKKTKKNPLFLIILSLSVLVILGTGSGILGSFITLRFLFPELISQYSNLEQKAEAKTQVLNQESAIIDVVEKNQKAVVSIVAKENLPTNNNSFFFFNFEKSSSKEISSGTGFLVSANGYLVTNRHVVSSQKAEYIVVTQDKKEYSAKVLARDPFNDIAILKIEAENLPYLELGDSDQLKIGQTVIAIGNTLGEFDNTVNVGIISGLRRSLTASDGLGDAEELENIIQTDAAINEGNSGGPLLDINGKVIGVNTAMIEGGQNISFALPINDIKKTIESVRTTGRLETTYLGVRYLLIDPEIASQNNLKVNYGALIVRGENPADLAIIPGSPADKAGLVENDIILEVDNVKIEKKRQLENLIQAKSPGSEITLKIIHKNEEKEIKLILEKRDYESS
jgi:serine protease Do